MTQIHKQKNPVQVAERLFLILETLAENGSLGLYELSEQLTLHKSTVHRLLTSLICLGYVKQDAKTSKYRLTFKIMEIANKMSIKLDITEIARPYLRQLMEKTGETVHLVQLEQNEAVYIDKVEAWQNSVRMVSKVGNHIPLYCSGVGKAIAARLENEYLKQIWDATEITKMTPYTITTFADFLKEVAKVREKGYALDNEENEIGVRCIAASLPGYEGNHPYAFSVSAPVNRMTDANIEQYSHYVLETGKQLQQALYGK